MSAPVQLQGGKRRGRTVLKALSWVLIAAGALLLVDAGLTLVWQEPISALYAKVRQNQLGDDLNQLETRRIARVEVTALKRLQTETAPADVPRPRRARQGQSGRPARTHHDPQDRRELRDRPGDRRGRPARGARATTSTRRCRASRARSRSPGTARPSWRPFRDIDQLKRSDHDPRADAVRRLHLLGRAHRAIVDPSATWVIAPHRLRPARADRLPPAVLGVAADRRLRAAGAGRAARAGRVAERSGEGRDRSASQSDGRAAFCVASRTAAIRVDASASSFGHGGACRAAVTGGLVSHGNPKVSRLAKSRVDALENRARRRPSQAERTRRRDGARSPRPRLRAVLEALEGDLRAVAAEPRTAARPRRTSPTQVTSAASAAARAPRRARTRTARSPRRRSRPARRRRRRARAPPRRRPARPVGARASISRRTPLASPTWRASVARPSERSISALAPASASASPASSRGTRAPVARRPARRGRRRAPRAPPGRRPRRPARRSRRRRRRAARRRGPTSAPSSSAQPTTVTATTSSGPRVTSPPASVDAGVLRPAPRRRAASARASSWLRRSGMHDGEIGLAGARAHGGEVGERAGQRPVPDVGGAERAPRRKWTPSTIASIETTA